MGSISANIHYGVNSLIHYSFVNKGNGSISDSFLKIVVGFAYVNKVFVLNVKVFMSV